MRDTTIIFINSINNNVKANKINIRKKKQKRMKKKRKNKVLRADYLFYKRGWRKPMNAKTN